MNNNQKNKNKKSGLGGALVWIVLVMVMSVFRNFDGVPSKAVPLLIPAAVVIVVVVILNNYMRSSGINITLLSFGVIQILLMLAISVAVAFLASFLPVRGIARKKPVDAIKDR